VRSTFDLAQVTQVTMAFFKIFPRNTLLRTAVSTARGRVEAYLPLGNTQIAIIALFYSHFLGASIYYTYSE
jgi:hypothetical protein